MAAYRRALAARWSVAPKARMTFPLWFSGAEQVLRYHAVRDNRFAHEADVPARLYINRHAYRAYLLENVLPGETGAPSKSVARMLATEGVVSALFYRLVNDATVQRADAPAETYARFGVERSALTPVEHACLKVFSAIEVGKFDAAAVVAAYQRLYPAERDAVDRIVSDTLLGQRLSHHTPIWLLNDGFKAGTTLFDQDRNMPRSHTFDLNASSMADLVGVAGVDAPLARALMAAAPFSSIDDVARVPRMTPVVMDRFRVMKAAMDAPPDPGTSEEGKLSIQGLLLPYAWRALAVWAVCAVVAGGLYRAVRGVRWWRLALAGLAAALAGLVAGWTIDPGHGLLALAAPVAVFGLPGAVIRLWRTRSFREAGQVVAAWALAALPSALAVTPLG
jgi:hypothetical protein